MKKLERESHIKIESHASFVLEFRNLLKKINDNITDLAQYRQVEMDQSSVCIAEELNRLKYHRKKLKTLLKKYSDADHANWMVSREEARRVFQNAYSEWLKASDEIASAKN